MYCPFRAEGRFRVCPGAALCSAPVYYGSGLRPEEDIHTGRRFSFYSVNIVLLEPEIPPNTGNVARLCAATRTRLHLIEPFGFKLDNAALKRAGMDYWQHVEWCQWPSWSAFEAQLPSGARLWFVEAKGPRHYAEVSYTSEDFLVFGRETAGLPAQLLAANPERWLRIPMFNPNARSLNLANCVAVVLYEALRQLGYVGEVRED